MSFFSGVDMNIDPEEKILASTFAEEPRERTPFEKESEEIDMARDRGYRADLGDEDWWGIPQISVMNQVRNMRRLETSQRQITTDPWNNYVTEGSQYDAGFLGGGGGGHGGRGYLEPATATTADLAMSAATPTGVASGGQLLAALAPLAASFLVPLISKGVSALVGKMGRQYKKGTGKKFPLSKREIAMAHSSRGLYGANPQAVRAAEAEILSQNTAGGFWKKLIDKTEDLSGQHIQPYFKEEKHRQRYGEVGRKVGGAYAKRLFTGSGVLSESVHRKLVGGKYDEPGDDVMPHLVMGHVLQPPLETAVSAKGGLGAGMNADEKQALLDLMYEADRDGMMEKVTPKKLASGGGFLWNVRRRMQQAARKAQQHIQKSEAAKGILGRFRQHIQEQLPKRLGQFAEKGVDVLHGALPEGQVKELMGEHKDKIKSMGRLAGEHAGKQLGERTSKKIGEAYEGTGAMRRPRMGRGERYEPLKKKNWHIRVST